VTKAEWGRVSWSLLSLHPGVDGFGAILEASVFGYEATASLGFKPKPTGLKVKLSLVPGLILIILAGL
jgi:hypothetical protein